MISKFKLVIIKMHDSLLFYLYLLRIVTLTTIFSRKRLDYIIDVNSRVLLVKHNLQLVKQLVKPCLKIVFL